MNAFITGTDTGAGKTYVTARLIRHLRARGRDTVGFKPICCGGREDAEILRAAADDALSLNEVNPVWLRTPAAPYTAALIENRAIDLDLIRETLKALRARHRSVLVEGVGGWLAPIRKDYRVADLAREIGFPVVVVVRNRLGALNHALLTVERLREDGATCAGLILNDGPPVPEPSHDAQGIAMATNRAVLEDCLGVPILGEIREGQEELKIDLSIADSCIE